MIGDDGAQAIAAALSRRPGGAQRDEKTAQRQPGPPNLLSEHQTFRPCSTNPRPSFGFTKLSTCLAARPDLYYPQAAPFGASGWS